MFKSILNWFKTDNEIIYTHDLRPEYKLFKIDVHKDNSQKWPNITKKPDHNRQIKNRVKSYLSHPYNNIAHTSNIIDYNVDSVLNVIWKIALRSDKHIRESLIRQIIVIIEDYNISPRIRRMLITEPGLYNEFYNDICMSKYSIKMNKESIIKLLSDHKELVFGILNERWKSVRFILKLNFLTEQNILTNFDTFDFPIKAHFIRHDKTIVVEYSINDSHEYNANYDCKPCISKLDPRIKLISSISNTIGQKFVTKNLTKLSLYFCTADISEYETIVF